LILHVVTHTDSFAEVWPRLARELQLEVELLEAADLDAPRAAAPLAAHLAVLVAAAGREEGAEPLVRRLRAAGIGRAFVVGARADHRLALMLARAGADEYFSLPADLELLRRYVGDLAERARGRQARDRHAEAERAAYDFGNIVGRSPQLRAALEIASRIIPRDRATVLVTGETGTGKELLARAIHYNGPRRSAPFVELNCAAIPAGLLESELFGHERGAFTDARSAKPGLFETAHGGTLFLDEIGHLPYELQGKILKALEEKRIRRLGAVVPREVDVRIMAATHVDLEAAVRAGEFREDLFYRLSIIPIELPPLRERGEDVLLLAEHFLRTLAAQYDLPQPAVTLELRRALLSHPWPGNVRELRNAVERALLLSDGTPAPADLFSRSTRPRLDPSGALPFPASLAQIEKVAARAMVERLDGNKSAAADALGISRSRLYRLLDAEAV
jgi:DNA-binding NtrC family response regulator